MPIILDGTTGIELTNNAGIKQTGNGAIMFQTALSANSGGTGLSSPGSAGNVLVSDGNNWTSAVSSTGKLFFLSGSN